MVPGEQQAQQYNHPAQHLGLSPYSQHSHHLRVQKVKRSPHLHCFSFASSAASLNQRCFPVAHPGCERKSSNSKNFFLLQHAQYFMLGVQRWGRGEKEGEREGRREGGGRRKGGERMGGDGE